MSDSSGRDLLAIEVGSSRVKFGWYPDTTACESDSKSSQLPIAAPKLREPAEWLVVAHVDESSESFFKQIGDWLEQLDNTDPHLLLASVHAEAAERVQEVLRKQGYQPLRQLTGADLPIKTLVEQPEKVGIDRLLNGVAANRLREADRPAIVIDLGTANTVDLITEEGAFAGGAILPGIAMSARALHDNTSALPHLLPDALKASVNPVGKSTLEAIASGLYWGAVGSVSELICRMSKDLDQSPQLFITGGDARLVASNVTNENGPAQHIPHMVLAGIYLTAGEES